MNRLNAHHEPQRVPSRVLCLSNKEALQNGLLGSIHPSMGLVSRETNGKPSISGSLLCSLGRNPKCPSRRGLEFFHIAARRFWRAHAGSGCGRHELVYMRSSQCETSQTGWNVAWPKAGQWQGQESQSFAYQPTVMSRTHGGWGSPR